MNNHFTKENTPITYKHMKRFLESLVIDKYKLKPQYDTTLYPLEWLYSKRLAIPSVDKNVAKLHTLLLCM